MEIEKLEQVILLIKKYKLAQIIIDGVTIIPTSLTYLDSNAKEEKKEEVELNEFDMMNKRLGL